MLVTTASDIRVIHPSRPAARIDITHHCLSKMICETLFSEVKAIALVNEGL